MAKQTKVKKEPKTFFGILIAKIADLFSKFPDILKSAIHIGVLVTENLKKVVDSDAADWLTKVIPGDIDDKIKVKLRESLPKILLELKLAEGCADKTNPDEIVKCAVETLQSIEGDFQSAFLHDLSILIAQVASDGKLSWEDGVIISQYYYTKKFKKV